MENGKSLFVKNITYLMVHNKYALVLNRQDLAEAVKISYTNMLSYFKRDSFPELAARSIAVYFGYTVSDLESRDLLLESINLINSAEQHRLGLVVNEPSPLFPYGNGNNGEAAVSSSINPIDLMQRVIGLQDSLLEMKDRISILEASNSSLCSQIEVLEQSVLDRDVVIAKQNELIAALRVGHNNEEGGSDE